MNSQNHIANPTLLENLVSKLPMSKRMEWARYSKDIYPYPTVVHFSDWISEVADLIMKVQGHVSKNPVPEAKRRVVLHATAENQNRCVLCEGQHKVHVCQQFVDKNVPERWEIVKRLKLCFLCLGSGHMTRSCKQRNCTKGDCNRKHNNLLHETERVQQPAPLERAEKTVLSCLTNDAKTTNTLFKIIPVTLYGTHKRVDTYALLDEGSSVTMMDASLISALGLKGTKRNLNIKWFGGRAVQELVTMVDLQISGEGMTARHNLKDVHGISNINLPLQSMNLNSLKIDQDLIDKLPTQSYNQTKPMLLIGLDNCNLILPNEVIRLKEKGPYAINTELGWVIYGPVSSTESSLKSCLLIRSSDDSLHEMVAEYFTTENFGVQPAPKTESEDEVRARHILQSTTQYINGRYQTGLLWKSDGISLPNSYNMALKRLVNIENKMKNSKTFANAYKKIFADYVQKNYARKLQPCEVATDNPRTWYLPHFAVTNPNKPGKIRLVFDAAASVGGTSLNSCLLKGPQEYQPMPSVLFNFRIGSVAVAADIREMFHQIVIRKEDRDSQRFLWRDGETYRNPDVYEMSVMTFGAACSPCAAQYVKVTNALNARDVNPRAVKSIVKYHYVDDYVDSFATTEEAVQISNEVKEIHSRAGFELRGFVSNSIEVLKALGEEGATQYQLSCDDNGLSTEKILGLYWQPNGDAFRFTLKLHRISPDIIEGTKYPTKRELLSIAMSVFSGF